MNRFKMINLNSFHKIRCIKKNNKIQLELQVIHQEFIEEIKVIYHHLNLIQSKKSIIILGTHNLRILYLGKLT